jgi:SAM-dependent methyltransferase
MNETSKSRLFWGEQERKVLSGKGIDIGCGADPVCPDVMRFDISDGDANEITRYINDQFDYVFSSHCLEHMHDPRKTILRWWKLVRPGGYLFFIVPDEDLYEQGIFPSRFNPDHKATFTISKSSSWSPASINVIDLVRSLPNAELVSIALHDQGYDRRLLKHGLPPEANFFIRFLIRAYHSLKFRTSIRLSLIEDSRYYIVDQTLRPDVLAQIQCIVKKTA